MTGIALDGRGGLFIGTEDAFSPGFGPGKLYWLPPGEDEPVLILELPAGIRGPVYDPDNDELYVHVVSGTDEPPVCSLAGGVLYRWRLGGD